jgi:transposase
MHLVYLPPYSPDFNPIEEAFLALKACRRWNCKYARGKLTGKLTYNPYSLLWEAVFASVTEDKV